MSDSIEIFRTDDGGVRLDVRTAEGSVWLTRQQLATLFGRDIKTIGKHVANAQREELAGLPVVAKFATTAADGKTYQVEHYDLDLVLSVGYRVKSAEGVRFRKWANNALAAITLLVAMSDPKEKDLMIALIIRMIVPETPEPIRSRERK